MDNKYYVYVFLDQRKPGKFVFDEFSFDYEPFYIGKGFFKRDKAHFRLSLLKNKNIKNNKINKIIKETGELPIHYRIKENLSEIQAFDLEKSLILKIGRVDLKTGTLVNLTGGGDGTSGRIITEKFRDRMREIHLGSKRTPEQIKNISEAHKGLKKNPETVKKISENSKKPVIFYNHEMQIIKEYDSMFKAAEETNYSIGTIWSSCRKLTFTRWKHAFRYKEKTKTII